MWHGMTRVDGYYFLELNLNQSDCLKLSQHRKACQEGRKEIDSLRFASPNLDSIRSQCRYASHGMLRPKHLSSLDTKCRLIMQTFEPWHHLDGRLVVDSFPLCRIWLIYLSHLVLELASSPWTPGPLCALVDWPLMLQTPLSWEDPCRCDPCPWKSQRWFFVGTTKPSMSIGFPICFGSNTGYGSKHSILAHQEAS